MSTEMESVKVRLVRYAEAVLIRRADRLMGRRVVLFPYLRAMMLLRKARRLSEVSK